MIRGQGSRRKNRRGFGNASTGSRGSRSRAAAESDWAWGCTFLERLLRATGGGSASRVPPGRALLSGLPCPWPPRGRRELPFHHFGSSQIAATRRHFASYPQEALAFLFAQKGGQQ